MKGVETYKLSGTVPEIICTILNKFVIPVNIIKNFVIGLNLCVALLTVILILTCRTSDSGLLSNNSSRFAPGSLDAAKNRIIAILIALFVSSIVLCGFLDNRGHKKQAVSLLDKLAKDNAKKATVPTNDS